MMALNKAIKRRFDFVILLFVKMANVNGDPNNNNAPRQDDETYCGLISDVCVKRWIRNWLQDMGYDILDVSDNRIEDDCDSIRARLESDPEINELLNAEKLDKKALTEAILRKYPDARLFGQLIALPKKGDSKKKKDDGEKEEKTPGISLGLTGPVTFRVAQSVEPIEIADIKITKSYNGDSGDVKGSDTFGGEKSFVKAALYPIMGSIDPYQARRTGCTEDDVELFRNAILGMMKSNVSAMKPAGSINVCKVFWWAHDEMDPKVSVDRVHRSVEIIRRNPEETLSSFEDYEVVLHNPDGCVEPEIYDLY